tara:strand:- start:56 stop:535 length:480 start_codon:yes stop_codon:yes gene_type:complete
MFFLQQILKVFLVTAIWDWLWQKMVERKIYICLSKKHILFCPNEWEWVKTGEKYFKEFNHPLTAMIIAGISGVYAQTFITLINKTFNLSWKNIPIQLLVIMFASWITGVIMRDSPDRVNTYLFGHAREHYYKPLGFWWSSYTDLQSGVIVAATIYLLGM